MLASLIEETKDEGLGSEECIHSPDSCSTKMSNTADKPTTLFGGNLIDILRESNRNIPLVVEVCAACIERQGNGLYGIYRLSGSASSIRALKLSFERNEMRLDPEDPTLRPDVHSLASLLKLFFRELEESLCTSHLHSSFLEAVKECVAEWGVEVAALRSILMRLPMEHFCTLAFLMGHLKRMSLFSDTTGMTARNLAIVWAPNLLRRRTANKKEHNNAFFTLDVNTLDTLRGIQVHANRMKEDVALQAICTEMLIVHHDQLFNTMQLVKEPGQGHVDAKRSLGEHKDNEHYVDGHADGGGRGCHKRVLDALCSLLKRCTTNQPTKSKSVSVANGLDCDNHAFEELHESNFSKRGIDKKDNDVFNNNDVFTTHASGTSLWSLSSSSGGPMFGLGHLWPHFLRPHRRVRERRRSLPAPIFRLSKMTEDVVEYNVHVEFNPNASLHRIVCEEVDDEHPSSILIDDVDLLHDFEAAWQEARTKLRLDVHQEANVSHTSIKDNLIDEEHVSSSVTKDQQLGASSKSMLKESNLMLSSEHELNLVTMSMTEELNNLWTSVAAGSTANSKLVSTSIWSNPAQEPKLTQKKG